MSIDRLSPRERLCLDRAADRVPQKVIAAELNCEVGTVDGYIKSAAAKLGVDRREAYRLSLAERSPVIPGSGKPGLPVTEQHPASEVRLRSRGLNFDWMRQPKTLDPVQTMMMIVFVGAVFLAAVSLVIASVAIISH